MDRNTYWLLRMATALRRAYDFGPRDWTNDIPQLLEEFGDEYGQFGDCETCNQKDQWVKVTEVGGSNPDTLKACQSCRHEVGFDLREAA